MKRRNILILCLILIISSSCDEEDLDRTLLEQPSDELAFENGFLPSYSVDQNQPEKVAETLKWNPISFGGQNVLVNYRVQGSVSSDFSSIDYESGNTTDLSSLLLNQHLIALAEAAGLDNDPQTTDPNGEPNNVGKAYLRTVSFVGNFDAVHEAKEISGIQEIGIELLEIQCEGTELSKWGFVGPFNGWNISGPPVYALLTGNAPNVFRGVVTIDDQGFKISVLDGSFSEGYAYGGTEGTLVPDTGFDPVIPSTPGHYLFTADLNSLTYTLEETKAYGLIGPATPNSWDGPNHKFVPDECETGIYVARNVPMVVGEFYIRANDDWTESYALGTGGEGTFQVNPGIGATGMPVDSDGNYDVIVNFNDFTYELIKIN